MKRTKIILIITASLILIGLVFSFGYFYFVVDRIENKVLDVVVDEIEQTEKMAIDFVRQSLREEFWPTEAQLIPQQDNTFLFAWVLEQTSFTVSGEISHQKKPYAINIFIPNKKTITQAQEAQKIFESYFIFSPEFTCEELQALGKQIFRCHYRTYNKLVLVMTEQDFETDKRSMNLSIMELVK